MFLNKTNKKEQKKGFHPLPFISRSPFRLQVLFYKKKINKRTLGNVLKQKRKRMKKKTSLPYLSSPEVHFVKPFPNYLIFTIE